MRLVKFVAATTAVVLPHRNAIEARQRLTVTQMSGAPVRVVPVAGHAPPIHIVVLNPDRDTPSWHAGQRLHVTLVLVATQQVVPAALTASVVLPHRDAQEAGEALSVTLLLLTTPQIVHVTTRATAIFRPPHRDAIEAWQGIEIAMLLRAMVILVRVAVVTFAVFSIKYRDAVEIWHRIYVAKLRWAIVVAVPGAHITYFCPVLVHHPHWNAFAIMGVVCVALCLIAARNFVSAARVATAVLPHQSSLKVRQMCVVALFLRAMPMLMLVAAPTPVVLEVKGAPVPGLVVVAGDRREITQLLRAIPVIVSLTSATFVVMEHRNANEAR